MRVLIAVEIGCSRNAAVARTRPTGGYLLLDGGWLDAGGKWLVPGWGDGATRTEEPAKIRQTISNLRTVRGALSCLSVIITASLLTIGVMSSPAGWGSSRQRWRGFLLLSRLMGVQEEGLTSPCYVSIRPSVHPSLDTHCSPAAEGRAVFTQVGMEHVYFSMKTEGLEEG